MYQNQRKNKKGKNPAEPIITAIVVGGVFILLGVIFVSTPGIFGAIGDLFQDFAIIQFPNTGVSLPAPELPWTHTIIYEAAFQFAVGIGILQIIILAIRLAVGSSISKISETIGNLIFWLGAAYLVPTFLNSNTTQSIWFEFWSLLILVVGISMIFRGIVIAIKK